MQKTIKRGLITASTLALLNGLSPAYAQNTVVVIPLGGGNSINSSSQPGNPVGTIINSMLTPAQLASTPGNTGPLDLATTIWVLADGQDVSGSQYALITGNSTVPDLRGMFLRGKNNARNDGNENPDGDTALGSYQADEFKSHTHSTVQMIANNTIDGVDSTTTFSSEHHNEVRPTGPAGGNETRAKNITINYYIKIN